MKTAIAITVVLLLGGCDLNQRTQAVAREPDFVKVSQAQLNFLQEPVDDLYLFNTFFDAGADRSRVDLMGALVILDGPKIIVTTWEDVSVGHLVSSRDGWTMAELPPQCVSVCTHAKTRLLDMFRTGGKATIDPDGNLIVRSPDGRRAVGNPLPMVGAVD